MKNFLNFEEHERITQGHRKDQYFLENNPKKQLKFLTWTALSQSAFDLLRIFNLECPDKFTEKDLIILIYVLSQIDRKNILTLTAKTLETDWNLSVRQSYNIIRKLRMLGLIKHDDKMPKNQYMLNPRIAWSGYASGHHKAILQYEALKDKVAKDKTFQEKTNNRLDANTGRPIHLVS